ncbi:DUF192 domain-containing protein [Roseovarius sp. EGI FJ00037]|nr:DUF192 domain-containing protein [Roseovarius sp. EGI FJ00037]
MIACVLLVFLAAPVSAGGVCKADQVTLRGDWGQARFTVELADDAPSRAKGLMNRDRLARSAGMLFVYPAPKRVGFWMKDTLIPLDMIFMDESGTVRRIHHNAQPHDLRPKMGGDAIQYVLEINGGLARQMGILEGSEMRHPSVAQDRAAWPC